MTAPDFRKDGSGYDSNFGESRFYGFGAALTRVAGDVALDRSYRGCIILFDSPSGGTITVPANLPAGFNVSVLQIGVGIVDLRKLDRGRILIELARIACADPPLRAAIATNGPNALSADQPVLLVDIRLEGALAKHIEMRLLDDRGALSRLLRYDGEPESPANLDLSQSVPADFAALERVLRAVLRNRERPVE
ncbi:hypothetical protein ACVWXN_002702 [Bradyrhizobium sp. i1.4.4]